MENLIDYILHTIMGCNLKVERVTICSKPAWRFWCEDCMLFIFDEADVMAFHDVYNSRKYFLDADEIAEYERFFSLCE